MKSRKNRRKVYIIAAVSVGFVIFGLILAGVYGYPAVVRWAVRSRIKNMGDAWNREVEVDKIEVGWGWVRLHGIVLRADSSGSRSSPKENNVKRANQDSDMGRYGSGCPLLKVTSTMITFEPFSLLRGKPRFSKVKISGPKFCFQKGRDGQSNFEDILKRLREGERPQRRTRLDSIEVRKGSMEYRDLERGIFFKSDSLDSVFVPGEPVSLNLKGVTFRKNNGPSGLAEGLVLSFDLTREGPDRFHPRVEIKEGRFSIHHSTKAPKLFLTKINGVVSPRDGRTGINLELTGAYKGADRALWRASGWVDLENRELDINLSAEKFTLDKLSSWLKSSWGRAVVNPKNAVLSGGIRFSLRDGLIRFEGSVDVKGLNIKHRKLAKKMINDLDFSTTLKGSYDFAKARMKIDSLEIKRKGVKVKVSLTVTRIDADPRISVSVEVPPVHCSAVIDALPEAVFPHVKKLEVSGNFSMGLSAGVDFGYLTDASVNLSGYADYDRCRVLRAPEQISAVRMLRPFEHVAIDGSNVTKVWVGPDNPDFVGLEMISRHVSNSLLTTEDSRFFKHDGFIYREFRSALARNLIAKKFKYGASSISMQLVKNVMLNREKTLSRKLEELILTAYLERHLDKKRILEIYLNVIEFGPGIYGIGHASRHYFGKPAALIEPQEAVFLSTLLPSPKKRYRHFCNGKVTTKWRRWMDRILKIMYERKRLTQEELELALNTPLVFSPVEFESKWHCMQRIKKYSK